MLPNTVKAIIRSLTPLIYSTVAAVIAHFGYHVSNTVVVQIVAGGYAGLSVVLHAMESQFPWVGALLGWIGAPVFAPSVKKQQASLISKLQSQVDHLTAQASPGAPVSETAQVS